METSDDSVQYLSILENVYWYVLTSINNWHHLDDLLDIWSRLCCSKTFWINKYSIKPNYFSGTELPLDLRPVCKFKFVRWGPGEKNQSALSFLVEAYRPDEVREHLFPNSEIEIFFDFCRFSTNSPNFQKILRGPV